MRSHWAPVLILCVFALAACQPSGGPTQAEAQTEAAQSAFDTAVAATQTQAAVPSPAPTQTAAESPPPPAGALPAGTAPTKSALDLQFMSEGMKLYVERVVSEYRPPDGAPYEAHVTFVRYQYFDNGNSAAMDVGIQKSDATKSTTPAAGVLTAFAALYSTELDPDGWRNRVFLPEQLRTFRIQVFGMDGKEYLRVSGNWEDMVANSQGRLTAEELMTRLVVDRLIE